MAASTLRKEQGFGSLRIDLTQICVGFIIWSSLAVLLYLSANQSPVQANHEQNLGSGFRRIPKSALEEYKPNPDWYIDSRIDDMDREKKFIGIGRGD